MFYGILYPIFIHTYSLLLPHHFKIFIKTLGKHYDFPKLHFFPDFKTLRNTKILVVMYSSFFSPDHTIDISFQCGSWCFTTNLPIAFQWDLYCSKTFDVRWKWNILTSTIMLYRRFQRRISFDILLVLFVGIDKMWKCILVIIHLVVNDKVISMKK